MTKQEILDSLEALKDFTNDNGKRAIDGIKVSVAFLQEANESQWPTTGNAVDQKANIVATFQEERQETPEPAAEHEPHKKRAYHRKK